MKSDELIESLSKIEQGEHPHIQVTIISREPRQFEIIADEKADLGKLQKIQRLLCRWQQSGIKRYRVRLLGLNSSHGKQYLSCEHDIHGKIFACAPNHFLKQTFTWDELNQLRNDTRFKGIAYFDQLLRTGIEEVKDDE
ncbi:hypothetical protein [Limosilactobacillus reuteri]|uniref:hypothetical protein n=1 Tax=Limosilactobacillus reuteri TaxID=1598 RepID=UPI00203FEDFF|nr:hypothetical protein [Limosilactobacillus reuteri]